MYFSIFSWEYPKYLGNSLRLVLFLYRIQQGSLQTLEYIDYSTGFGKKNPNNWENHQKESSEMAKFAIPAQEISENSEKLL